MCDLHRRFGIAAIAVVLFSGCAALAEMDRALYETVPIHPVTGTPVANVVSEADEVRSASDLHARIVGSVGQAGLQLDPPGPHLDQMIRVLQRLAPVATSHRPSLPWQYWLIPNRVVNAFATGGGYVYVHDGLWGSAGLIREWDDDELAFVLAHEIAHVNLLHISLRKTQALFNDRIREDPFFSASFTTEQEAEADRLAVLYVALAGYDAEAGARIWERTRDTEADHGYRNSHPVGLDRANRVRQAVASVAHFRVAGQTNAEWQRLLADNPLFPRVATVPEDSAPVGAGLAKALVLGAQVRMEHEAAKQEAKRREEAALRSPQQQAGLVRVVAVQSGNLPGGQPAIQMQFQNGAIYDVVALGVRVVYLNGDTAIAEDPKCGGPALIPAGQTIWLACTRYPVQGATQYRVEITGVQFR